MQALLFIMLLLPLAGAAINALLGGRLSRQAVGAVACAAVLGALTLAAVALVLGRGDSFDLVFFSWFEVGRFSAHMSVHYDPLAAIMALMVTLVASVIHLYSIPFMRGDPEVRRYFCYLNLFVFAMLLITLADNLVFVYLGWEGVGFCSYALIGFWYSDPAKASAGRKAFLFTRLGDVAFGVALALCLAWFSDLSIVHINAQAAALGAGAATILGLLLLWAALGKSAQLPLTVWLPEAMAGPSPVSALIHAATMVTAGVYLLMRLFPVLMRSPQVLLVIAALGAVSALYAACAALAQRDIKRMLAYSTISQVGYMFLAVGAGDIVGGMFHLLSHAFFKSLLFLSAGIVIQALAEEHDIFRMGNLRRLLPGAARLFLVGALCLSAFPLLGGFFSKDRILLATFLQPGASYRLLWVLAALAALLTPLYTFRAYFLAFGSRPGGRRTDQVRATPRFMTWILLPLALLALGDGLLNLPFGAGKGWLARFLSPVPGSVADLGAPAYLMWMMGLGSALGVLLTIWLARRLYGGRQSERLPVGWQKVLGEAFYLDRLYHLALVRPYRAAADFLWNQLDEASVDQGYLTLGVGLGHLSQGLSRWAGGRLTVYLVSLLAGLAAMLLLLAFVWYAG